MWKEINNVLSLSLIWLRIDKKCNFNSLPIALWGHVCHSFRHVAFKSLIKQFSTRFKVEKFESENLVESTAHYFLGLTKAWGNNWIDLFLNEILLAYVSNLMTSDSVHANFHFKRCYNISQSMSVILTLIKEKFLQVSKVSKVGHVWWNSLLLLT